MPVTKEDLAQSCGVSLETVSYCAQVGILRLEETGDMTCFTPNSYLHMKIYLKGKQLGLSAMECRALIDQAEEDARAKSIAYARQMAVKAARYKKPS